MCNRSGKRRLTFCGPTCPETPTASAFPMCKSDRGAIMIRKDMEEARAAWLKEVENDAEELKARNESHFLSETDERKRVVDFHALRTATSRS